MVEELRFLSAVAVAGFACGFLNAAASSGSVVSLPVLIFIGLDPLTANATNRIPVLVGAIAGAASFHRQGLIRWPMAWRIAVPSTLGALLGAALVESIPSRNFALVVTGAIVLAFILLVTKLKDTVTATTAREIRWGWSQFGWFFGIGLWLGIIVIDGATYLLLALVLSVGLPLTESNALKTLMLIPATIIAMLVFAYEGQIAWSPGLVMALGSIAGGVAGARLAGSVRRGRWTVTLLYIVLLGEIMHLVTHYALTIM